MANVVLIPCVKLKKKDFGTDYSNWENLADSGFIAWKSAVNFVESADSVILQHLFLEIKTHQNLERAILSKCIELHDLGHSILLLEADTICVKPVNLFNSGLSKMTLFAFVGAEDDEEIPERFNLNSGVVYWPSQQRQVREVLSDAISAEWPNKWAYYQVIWNRAFYSQFESKESGKNYVEGLKSGMYNYFHSPEAIPGMNSCKIEDAAILHLFTSRSVRNARRTAILTYRFNLRGYKAGLFIVKIGKVLVKQKLVNKFRNYLR